MQFLLPIPQETGEPGYLPLEIFFDSQDTGLAAVYWKAGKQYAARQ